MCKRSNYVIFTVKIYCYVATISISISIITEVIQQQQRSDVQLSERLASPGIMWNQLRAILKPLGPSQSYLLRDLRGALK